MNYKLIERSVSPSQMLLDPNNPRLRTDDFRSHVDDPAVIASDNVQESLMERICTDEHAIEPLMVSIRNQGFVELDSILARRLPDGDKFVIVEGNRRTAAVKQLLRAPQFLSQTTRTSLQSIPIKEIICLNPQTQQEVIDSIVALRHISGPKDWQPMQRAYAIFTAYQRHYRKKYGNSPLVYADKVMQEVSFMLAQDVTKVREEIYVFYVFSALQNAGYAVRSDHYSLIYLMVTRPRVASDYFDYNRRGFRIASLGLERFNKLCIENACPIQNPKGFRAFCRIFQDGNSEDIALVENGARSIDLVVADITDRKKDKLFFEKTNAILNTLLKLQLSSFRESAEEAEVIFRIKALIDRRLWPLAAKVLDIESR